MSLSLVFHINDSTDDQVLFQAACKQVDVPFQWQVADTTAKAISYFNSLRDLSATQPVRWPDLVVLDLGLPDEHGFKVLEHVRSTKELRRLPVIILSGRLTPAVRDEAARLGANSVLAKPQDFSTSVELVANLYALWSSVQRPTL